MAGLAVAAILKFETTNKMNKFCGASDFSKIPNMQNRPSEVKSILGG